MLTALYTCVSPWTDSSPNLSTSAAAITTCSTGKPVATASISKFRSTKLCTQSWQSDGGSTPVCAHHHPALHCRGTTGGSGGNLHTTATAQAQPPTHCTPHAQITAFHTQTGPKQSNRIQEHLGKNQTEKATTRTQDIHNCHTFTSQVGTWSLLCDLGSNTKRRFDGIRSLLQTPKPSKPIFVQPLMHPSFTSNLRTFLKQAISKHKDHITPFFIPSTRPVSTKHRTGSAPQVAPRTPESKRRPFREKFPDNLHVLREIQRATRPENLGVAAPQSHTKMAPQQRPTRPKGRRNGGD